MIVIKLGGSLINDANTLIQCLQTIADHKSAQIIIVPGGGLFADQVRHTQQHYSLSDRTAHGMAILAMQQIGWLFNDLQPDFVCLNDVNQIVDTIQSCSKLIWQPDIAQLDAANIPANWHITSDSLAAWLANQLQVSELILVKSVPITKANGLSIKQMQQRGWLDLGFNSFITHASYKLTIINKYCFNDYFNA